MKLCVTRTRPNSFILYSFGKQIIIFFVKVCKSRLFHFGSSYKYNHSFRRELSKLGAEYASYRCIFGLTYINELKNSQQDQYLTQAKPQGSFLFLVYSITTLTTASSQNISRFLFLYQFSPKSSLLISPHQLAS